MVVVGRRWSAAATATASATATATATATAAPSSATRKHGRPGERPGQFANDWTTCELSLFLFQLAASRPAGMILCVGTLRRRRSCGAPSSGPRDKCQFCRGRSEEEGEQKEKPRLQLAHNKWPARSTSPNLKTLNDNPRVGGERCQLALLFAPRKERRPGKAY